MSSPFILASIKRYLQAQSFRIAIMEEIMLLSPKLFKMEGRIIVATTHSFEYVEPLHGVKIPKTAHVLTVGEMIPNAPILEVNMDVPSDEKLTQYVWMQAMVKTCVDNAEEIKSLVHRIYIANNKADTEEERKEMMKLDFLSLKDWFMQEIRGTKIYQEFSATYNSTQKLKPFSRAFNAFVLDRNKYTHGQVYLVKPNYDFVLEYIETPSQQKKYATIDIDTLNSYNECYVTIRALINEYNRIHQNKRTEEYIKRQTAEGK